MLSYGEIVENFEKTNAWGLSSTIDLKNCDPKLIRSQIAIKRYVKELCHLIKMKRFSETRIVHFGDDEKVAGFSMVQLIETSLISGHFANLTSNAYIDIFSCRLFDPYVAAVFTKDFFKASSVSINTNFRY